MASPDVNKNKGVAETAPWISRWFPALKTLRWHQVEAALHFNQACISYCHLYPKFTVKIIMILQMYRNVLTEGPWRERSVLLNRDCKWGFGCAVVSSWQNIYISEKICLFFKDMLSAFSGSCIVRTSVRLHGYSIWNRPYANMAAAN